MIYDMWPQKFKTGPLWTSGNSQDKPPEFGLSSGFGPSVATMKGLYGEYRLPFDKE